MYMFRQRLITTRSLVRVVSMSAVKKQRTESTLSDDTACVGVSVYPFATDNDASAMHFAVDVKLQNTVVYLTKEDNSAVDELLSFSSLVARATDAWMARGFVTMKIVSESAVPFDDATAANPACRDTKLALHAYFLQTWFKANRRSVQVMDVISKQLANTPCMLSQRNGPCDKDVCDVRNVGLRLYVRATADAPRAARELLAEQKAAKQRTKYQAEANKLFDAANPASLDRLVHVTTNDLTGFVPEDTMCFDLVVKVTVAGSHAYDSSGVSPEVDIDDVRRVTISKPPAEFQALDLASAVAVAFETGATHVMLDDFLVDFKAAYQAIDIYSGEARIAVPCKVYVPADIAERKQAVKRAAETEKDKWWKDSLNKVLSTETNRMAEPVMCMSKADFDRIKRLDCFSLFPHGSQWLCLDNGVFTDVSATPQAGAGAAAAAGAGGSSLLPLSKTWDDALRNTIALHNVSVSATSGPIYLCVLADVVSFVQDPTSVAPPAIPILTAFPDCSGPFDSWSCCWWEYSSMYAPTSLYCINVSWTTAGPTFEDDEDEVFAAQLTKYYNHCPFSRAHVMGVVKAHTMKVSGALGDFFL
jgi:hypothetical protein